MDQAAPNDTSDQNTSQLEPTNETKSETSATPISDLVARPDFPECTRGALVNIGGYTGMVIDIVGNSLKVRASDNSNSSFNIHVLRRLYAPREEHKPNVSAERVESTETSKPERKAARNEPGPSGKEEPEPEKRNVILEPNFNVPLKPISEFTGLSDFPQCAFGAYVDIGGYKGVVVEIVKASLKVRSPEEVIRSYNSQVLRKLYPAGK